jgi:hypothetical protein
MSDRRLPVVPDLDQLKHQAKDLLRAMHRGDTDAIAELQEHHPTPPPPADAKLADAQLVLARSYGASSWARLVQSCKLIAAIWADDPDTVRELVVANPNLLHEHAGIRNNNWGPPLSYAANVGRDRIITMLHELGATDLEHGIDRAVLQGRIDTARLIHRMMGSPKPPGGSFGSPAYTLSVPGTEFLFAIGAELRNERGELDAPVDVVIESDSRNPGAMHKILALYAEHGFEFPDTPVMALFRGRLDLLDEHLRRDPGLLQRTFTFEEIYPPSLKCQPLEAGSYDEHLPRTPIANATLLHIAVEFDELDTAHWLLDHGMSANVRAAVDENGFGGHTPLFNAVVSYPNFWMNFTGGWAHSRKPQNAAFAELLLERGADPNARASFREGFGGTFRDHRDVTPVEWGGAFHNRMIVSEPAIAAIVAAAATGA